MASERWLNLMQVYRATEQDLINGVDVEDDLDEIEALLVEQEAIDYPERFEDKAPKPKDVEPSGPPTPTASPEAPPKPVDLGVMYSKGLQKKRRRAV